MSKFDFTKILENAEKIKKRNILINDVYEGSKDNYRIDKKQEPHKILKLNVYDINNDKYSSKYFLRISGFYKFLNKHNFVNIVGKYSPFFELKELPLKWNTSEYEYSVKYIDENDIGPLYKLDLPIDNETENTSYWMDIDNNVYKEINSQHRIEKRTWYINEIGTKSMIFKKKNLNYNTILDCKTTKELNIKWRS